MVVFTHLAIMDTNTQCTGHSFTVVQQKIKLRQRFEAKKSMQTPPLTFFKFTFSGRGRFVVAQSKQSRESTCACPLPHSSCLARDWG